MSGSFVLGVDDDYPAPPGAPSPDQSLVLALIRVLAGVKVLCAKTEAALHSGFGSDGDDDGAIQNLLESMKQLHGECRAGSQALYAVGRITLDKLSTISAVSVIPDDGIPDTDDGVIEMLSGCHDALSDAWDEVSDLAEKAGYTEISDFADACSDAHDSISEALDGDDEDNGEDTHPNGTDTLDDDDGFGGPVTETYVRHGQDMLAQRQQHPQLFVSQPEIRCGARTDGEIAAQQAQIKSDGLPPIIPDAEWQAKGAAIGSVKLNPRQTRQAARPGARTPEEVAARQNQLATEG